MEKVRRVSRLEVGGRITPREVLEAYEKTGLEPIFDDWYDTHCIDLERTTHACGFTAVMLASKTPMPKGVHLYDAIESYARERFDGAGEHYKGGFALGFDGKDAPLPSGDDHPLMRGSEGWSRLGWCDGKRARAFVEARLG